MAGQESLGEFELIARYLAPLASSVPGAYGLRDDAAIIRAPAGHDIVVTTDAMIEGVHFLKSDGAQRIARKLLRVNLSDLAAKGAEPIGYQLVLGLPVPLDEAWLEAFTAGLAMDQKAFNCPLHGGDTTRSPSGITLAITAFGAVPTGQMLRRGGAVAGDDLYVTGSIGDAALGLEAKLNGRLFSSAAAMVFDARLHLPSPRLAFGAGLRNLAHAAMDISDGLVQDVGHIAAASGLRAVLNADSVPLSQAARQALADAPELLSVILGGGDDYELVFSAPPAAADRLRDLSKLTRLNVTKIGYLEPGHGVGVLDSAGRPVQLEHGGFQHFAGPA
ncbi:MAG TPA: thiamine-phosphate kinase [Ferrovibrio sp.]|uniref:thiamine-phosphate kinase n=1 Tax=Ferrovibrio sp. TaxID=1917215 RepID=UPI002B4ADE9E|nr:thiamine-phosphate kinase [Ferrovibrio sp.]HLT79232.1 thiamine-phosphate kinase [Ferrovibrio sp.]